MTVIYLFILVCLFWTSPHIAENPHCISCMQLRMIDNWLKNSLHPSCLITVIFTNLWHHYTADMCLLARWPVWKKTENYRGNKQSLILWYFLVISNHCNFAPSSLPREVWVRKVALYCTTAIETFGAMTCSYSMTWLSCPVIHLSSYQLGTKKSNQINKI